MKRCPTARRRQPEKVAARLAVHRCNWADHARAPTGAPSGDATRGHSGTRHARAQALTGVACGWKAAGHAGVGAVNSKRSHWSGWQMPGVQPLVQHRVQPSHQLSARPGALPTSPHRAGPAGVSYRADHTGQSARCTAVTTAVPPSQPRTCSTAQQSYSRSRAGTGTEPGSADCSRPSRAGSVSGLPGLTSAARTDAVEGPFRLLRRLRTPVFSFPFGLSPAHTNIVKAVAVTGPRGERAGAAPGDTPVHLLGAAHCADPATARLAASATRLRTAAQGLRPGGRGAAQGTGSSHSLVHGSGPVRPT